MQTIQRQQFVAIPTVAGKERRQPEQPRAPSSGLVSKGVSRIEELRTFFAENETQILQKARILCRGDIRNAEEIVQELYPRMVRVLERSGDATLRSPWAVTHTVLARLAIDRYRHERRTRARIKRLEFPDSVPDEWRRPQLTSEDIGNLTKALACLNPRLQAIVTGVFFEGCKAKDVARRLGISEPRMAELKKLALVQLCEVLS